MQKSSLLIVVLFLLPPFVSADILISEIAWMGTENSANDEWIELHNTESTNVSLNGWILKSTDETPYIELSGSISANGYFLLERTDDTSAGPSADLIYTGALSNTGENLKLINSSGIVVDEVSSGSDWTNVGGDSVTKETAQYVDGNWITARATPKASNSNSSGGTEELDVENDETDPVEDSQEKTKPSQNRPYEVPEDLDIYISVDKNPVLAKSPVTFDVDVYDLKGNLVPATLYWNMGDGGTKTVGHIYSYTYENPGIYTVVVDARYRGEEATKKVRVKVLEHPLYISEAFFGGSGFITIKNDSPEEINISRWSIFSAENMFSIPHNTFIAPNSSIKFESQKLGFPVIAPIGIAYPDGRVAFQGIAPKDNKIVSAEASIQPSFVDIPAVPPDLDLAPEPASDQVANVISTSVNENDQISRWAVLLSIVLLIGIIGIIILEKIKNTRLESGVADEYDIEEVS